MVMSTTKERFFLQFSLYFPFIFPGLNFFVYLIYLNDEFAKKEISFFFPLFSIDFIYFPIIFRLFFFYLIFFLSLLH